VAKFRGDRPRELGDYAMKKKKNITSKKCGLMSAFPSLMGVTRLLLTCTFFFTLSKAYLAGKCTPSIAPFVHVHEYFYTYKRTVAYTVTICVYIYNNVFVTA